MSNKEKAIELINEGFVLLRKAKGDAFCVLRIDEREIRVKNSGNSPELLVQSLYDAARREEGFGQLVIEVMNEAIKKRKEGMN